jgi:DNA-binding response OmpR family regulator
MKILLVCDRDDIRNTLQVHFDPHGASIIHYWNPIKAMDNLDEIAPDAVVFSTQDYPRHWKPFVIFLRSMYSREQSLFILLTGDDFTVEEANKAQHLGVNGLIHEDLTDTEDLEKLKDLLSRHKDMKDFRQFKRIIPATYDSIGFLCNHPENLQIIHGKIRNISASGICLEPAYRERTSDIAEQAVLDTCTLRVGDAIFNVRTRVVRNDTQLHLNFEDLDESSRGVIHDYLTTQSARELKLRIKAS